MNRHTIKLAARCFVFVVASLSTVFAAALGYEGAQLSRENFADLGTVTVINPATPARDLLIVLDDSAEIPDELYELANRGHLIAHAPLPQFLNRVTANKDECIYAVTLLDVFSQHLQQKFRFAQYQRPLLIGLDNAASFVLATLAQAPNHLFQAGVGVRFRNEIRLPTPPCAAPELIANKVRDRIYRIDAKNVSTPWYALANARDIDGLLDDLAQKNADPTAVGDLALVELPLQSLSRERPVVDKSLADTFVILLSGDGGWANIDKDIGEELNRVGLPVIGWNSLQYFWSEKTPEQASRDLARAIAHYQKTWNRPRVLLIGFSLGADVLPFMISRLPNETKAAIADTVFLGLGRQVDFQFHVTDWLGGSNSNARPIKPELAKLSGQPMLCIYGKEDDETMCAEKPIGLDVIELPGDHHFDGDYQRATRLILDHLKKTRQ